MKNERNSKVLVHHFPKVAANADVTMAALKKLNVTIGETTREMGDATKIVSAGRPSTSTSTSTSTVTGTSTRRRVDDGQQALDLIKPRLGALEKRMTALESRMYLGNLTTLVKDAVDDHIVNTVEVPIPVPVPVLVLVTALVLVLVPVLVTAMVIVYSK